MGSGELVQCQVAEVWDQEVIDRAVVVPDGAFLLFCFSGLLLVAVWLTQY